MKTTATFIIAVLMALATTAQVAPVTSTGTIEVTYPGQVISIPIHVSEFANVDAISLSLMYDKTALQFVEFTSTGGFYLQAVDNVGKLRIGGNFYSAPVSYEGGVIAVVTMKWMGGKDAVLDWEDNSQACYWSTPAGALIQTAANYENGYVIASVTIGDQKWSLFNMNVGTRASTQLNNGVTEKFCYGGKDLNCDIYGGLYQWAEAMQYYNGVTNTTHWNLVPQGYIQGICPSGWHIPTAEEFNSLINTLGGNDVAGGKIKETGTAHWGKRVFPMNQGASNSSGFTSLPSGGYLAGKYQYLNEYGNMWTVTKGQQAVAAHWFGATFAAPNMMTGQSDKAVALAVRCIANTSISSPGGGVSPEGYGTLPALIAPTLSFASQTFVVPVTVKNFNAVTSGEIYFDFNPNIMSVSAITVEASAPGLSAMVDVSKAMVKIACTVPVSLIDGTVLFTITFSRKADGVSVVAWEPETKWNGQAAPTVNLINGSIKVN